MSNDVTEVVGLLSSFGCCDHVDDSFISIQYLIFADLTKSKSTLIWSNILAQF